MNLWPIFLTGLLAGGASCAAVQGGLLAGAVSRQGSAAPARSIRSDLVPVGWFLAGKMGSHVILGALLGALGDAVQIGFRTRALLQIGAGLVMVVMALNLWGVKGFERILPTPPERLTRLVRRSGRVGGGGAPVLLGLATVFIPCGVTLSVAVLAVASGSWVQGAAIMAVFVLGTSPLFAALGYAARRSARALRGQLSKVTAVAVIVMGLFSINAGLVLTGSPVSASSALAALGDSQTSRASSSSDATADPEAVLPGSPVVVDGVQQIRIRALNGGYAPNLQIATAGLPTELIIETRGTQGCTRAFVIPAFGVQATLPEDGDTIIALGDLPAGRLDYTCGMGMYRGAIEVM